MCGVNIDETSSNGCNFLKGTIFGENAQKRDLQKSDWRNLSDAN